MYFVDGPLDYAISENTTAENLYDEPTGGMPSVRTDNSRPFRAAEVTKSIKSIHGQLMKTMAEIGVFDEDDDDNSSAAPVVKSADKATELRVSGNEKYARSELEECHKLYSESVATAPEGSLEQVLAFGNRSAVLLRLKFYESCLHDVNRALASGLCPEMTRRNLEERRERCRARLVDGGNTTVDVNSTDPVYWRENDDDAEWRALCQFGNPLIPNASSKFKIVCDNHWGRHLVATEDIAPGEILSVQKYNALMLHVKNHKARTHCAHCLSRCLALIPCLTCTKVMYCSTHCRERAYETYHRVECQLMYRANRPYKFRALHTLIEGTEQLTKIPELMRQMPATAIFAEKTDPSNRPFVNDYMAVLRMSRTYNDSFATHFLSFVSDFINALRYGGFCGQGTYRSRNAAGVTREELFVATLLLNHAVTTRSHTFAICPAEDFSFNWRENVVGMGVCALHSFVNHSCFPNVSFFSRNRQHVMMALRPIKKGEQLFHTYWKSFDCFPIKKERIRMLSMFFGFTCKCEACTKNWPANLLGAKGMKVPKLVFLSRNQKAAKRKFLELLTPLTGERVMQLRNAEIIKSLRLVIEWIHDNLKTPSYARMECETALVQFMELTYDYLAWKNTAEEIKTCVQLVFEKLIGPTVLASC